MQYKYIEDPSMTMVQLIEDLKKVKAERDEAHAEADRLRGIIEALRVAVKQRIGIAVRLKDAPGEDHFRIVISELERLLLISKLPKEKP